MKKIILFALILSYSYTLLSQTSLPSIELKNIDGEYIKIENTVEKDQVLVISLWATWCVPCINELDAIQEYYEDWQEETNFKLIAISIDNARTTSRVKNGNMKFY